MDINYELYKVFYHVATTLSFSEAANKLFISQSAVSQSIKALEKKLNQKLFIRSTKKVRLTPEGELLLRHVEPAMNLIHRGEIKVTNATSIHGVELLENGQVDLIVVNSPNPYLGNCETKHIRSFQDVFVANHSFDKLVGRCLSYKELLEHPILMLDKKCTTSEFQHNLFLQHQLDLVPEIELSSNDLLIDLAKIGLGIACIPDYCITGKDLEKLFIVETKEKLPVRELVIAYNDRVPITKAATEFLNYF